MTPTPSAAPAEPSDAREMLSRYRKAVVESLARDAAQDEFNELLEAGTAILGALADAPKGEPTAEPVAWLRNFTDPQPHAVTNLNYRSAADVDAGVEYRPVYAAPAAQPSPTMADAVAASEPNWKEMYERREKEAHQLSEEIIRLRRVASSAGTPHEAQGPSTDAEHAAWLADKIGALGDYAKEAAEMLRRWPAREPSEDAKDAARVPTEPLFWYRPIGGMYEGPIHHKSVNGKFLRDAKPDEWVPLYPAPQQARAPMTEEQIEDLRGDANRGFDIEREDYFKAFRDAERAHGIGQSAKEKQ